MATLAITGATGGIGGRVARRLADRGVAQRLVVRDPARAPELPGAEVAQASYGDGEALRRALDGVGTLLLVSGSEAFDRVRLHGDTVDAAVAAGVQRIVYTSFLACSPDATFTFARDHWHTEEHIRQAGVRHTFLRDSLYLDVFPFFAGGDGVIRGPAGDGRVAAVARDDIADVAVAVLLGDGHDGRTYDLTGPEAFTLQEAAEELSRASGRAVTYHAETMEEAYASRAGYGAPHWEVTGWVTTYAAIATGELDVVSDAVATLAGHPPMGLAEYLRRNPDSMRHLVPG
jgi:NAD(P)H dehydrogenase (quinone)